MPAWPALIAAVSAAAWAGTAGPLAKAHALYWQGDQARALEAYRAAVRAGPQSAEAWLNGGVVLEELGDPGKAAEWYARAARLDPSPEIRTALGWAQFRAGRLLEARTSLEEAVKQAPADARALLGLGRVCLAGGRPRDAAELLDRAARADPLLTLAHYFKAQAHAARGEDSAEMTAYRECVIADSMFIECREGLALAQLRAQNYGEARRHLTRVLELAPTHRRVMAQLERLRHVAQRLVSPTGPIAEAVAPAATEPLGAGRVPRLRIGVGTNPMGKPAPRSTLSFSVSAPFWLLDARRGRKLARGEAGQTWGVRSVRSGKRLVLAVTNPDGKILLRSRDPLMIRGESGEAMVALDELRRRLRGDVELVLHGTKGAIKIVNTIDLENYTHGVLAMEMPIASPLEALKAQAVLARGHALFLKTLSRRHKRDGYDLCDGQHCQVYGGAGAEGPRSRAVILATWGKVVEVRGRLAHVIYSSNCGGHTQNGSDLTGWGEVAYWKGVPDGGGELKAPATPWRLRRWLQTVPAAFCKPSTYVHPPNFRWKRIIPARDLDEKVNRRHKLGRILSVRPGRRSAGGHVNSLTLRGTRGSRKITSELTLRGLLGAGSLRSTLFIIETEYGAGRPGEGRPIERLVIHGGGWGHAVGVCQAGAMGRAEAGASYETILSSYFPGAKVVALQY